MPRDVLNAQIRRVNPGSNGEATSEKPGQKAAHHDGKHRHDQSPHGIPAPDAADVVTGPGPSRDAEPSADDGERGTPGLTERLGASVDPGPGPGPSSDAAPSTDDGEPRSGAFPLITAPAPLSTVGHLRGRLDVLDGIRAVAVALVVAFHVGVPGAFAGFLGVDLFFVLSGFLISTLLLRQMHRHGRVRLAQFWARRVLRLLPASLLMMAAVATYGLTQATSINREALLTDLQWCLVYLGNWHFIAQSSYFLNDGSVSPLQHVWSLAVEEQFYLVWPIGIALVGWGLRRARQRKGSSALYRAWGRFVRGLMPLVTLHERLARAASSAPEGTTAGSAGTPSVAAAETSLAVPSTSSAATTPAPAPTNSAATAKASSSAATTPALTSPALTTPATTASALLDPTPRPYPATFSAARIARLDGTHPRPWTPLNSDDTESPSKGLRRFLPPAHQHDAREVTFAGPVPGRIPSLEDLATRSPGWMRFLTRLARGVRDATRAPDMKPATIELLLLLGVFTVVMGTASGVVMALLFDPQHPERAYMGTDTKLFEPLVGGMAAAAMIWPGVRDAVRRRAAWLFWPSVVCLVAAMFTLGGADGASTTYFTGGAFAFSLAAATLIAVLVSGAPRDVFEYQPHLSYMAYLDAATQDAQAPRTSNVRWSGARPGAHGGLRRALGSGERRLRGALVAALAAAPVAYLGRISYGIYLWHWPLIVVLMPDRSQVDPLTIGIVVVASVAAAAVSYHVIEKPILTGRFASVRPRLVLVSGAVVALAATVAVFLFAAQLTTPAHHDSPSTPQTQVAAPPSLLFVGDSVPSRLGRFLENAASPYGIDVEVAAVGGCGGMPINSSIFTETDCTTRVPEIQNKYLLTRKFTAVVWWSRWEMAPRKDPDLGEITQETQRFWHRQKADLQRNIERLSRSATTIVIVEPERVGQRVERVLDRSPKSLPHVMTENPSQVRQKWIEMLRAEAKADPRVKLVSVDALVCRNAANPCDDRLPIRETAKTPFAAPQTGTYARSDGTHFDAPAVQPVISRALVNLVRGVLPAGALAPSGKATSAP